MNAKGCTSDSVVFPVEWPCSQSRSSSSDQQKDGALQVNCRYHILAVFWGELHLICISACFFFLRLFAYINESICIIKKQEVLPFILYMTSLSPAGPYRTWLPEGEVSLSELNTGTGLLHFSSLHNFFFFWFLHFLISKLVFLSRVDK